MRILHVCKHFYPRVTGVTAHVEHLSREQARAGHTVAVATWGEAAGEETRPGLCVLRARPGDREGLMRLMADFEPDVLHAHSVWDVSHAAARTARRLGRPYVVTAHGTWHLLAGTLAASPWRERLRWGLWQRRVLWPRLLRGAGTVIALNAEEEADALAADVPAGRLVRIPNAVDTDVFFPGEAGGGGEDTFPVLFVGAMEANKGILDVVAAAGLLRKSLPRARWLLCGDGPDLPRARRAAVEAGVGEVAHFLGRVDRSDMPALYRRARLVVAPSRAEAFSTALLEAMATGLPCVGSRVGGTPEIIDHGGTGLLIPPADARALADAVRWLAEHPREAGAMGRAGREKAGRCFAWPLVAGRIERAYRLALAVFLACLLGLAWLGRPAEAARIFPADILAMVDPRTGQAVAGEDARWREASAVWDGRTVRVAAARGEATAFQLILVPDPGERLENIRIAVDLPGDVSFRSYRAWHIWDVPEVAVPLGPHGAPFAIPAACPAERQATSGYAAFATVVELAVPRTAAAGAATGEVRVAWNGGGVALPLVLTVLPLDLPLRPAFSLEMNSYGDYQKRLPAGPETFLRIHRLFRRFRATFTLVPYRHDGSPVEDFLVPPLSADGRPDFVAFDTVLSGLFDGTAFDDGEPVDHFVLPLATGWPAAWGTDRAAYARRNIGLRLALARHIRERGWCSTRFQEFHNENPEHGARVPWRLDEPVTALDMAGHDLFAGFNQTAGRVLAGPSPLRYRIDISAWQPLRARLRRLAGRQVTDWSVSAEPAYLDREAVAFFRGLGAQWLVAYGELPGFAAGGRTTPWWRFPLLLARFEARGLSGYAQWQVDRWQGREGSGLSRDAAPLFHASASGARDFIWPGTFFGLPGPLPSLRLFALREGLNLLDYLSLACARRPDLAAGLRARLAGLAGADALRAFKTQLASLATGRSGS
uniref:Glycosyltransferase n=1 Tax=Desulfovibrio sp. U5L TaxID=596152 RepID=I2Q321_9BACT